MGNLLALKSRNSWGRVTSIVLEHGHLPTNTQPDGVNALRANPTLYRNDKELCQLHETLPGAVADIFRAKKKGQRTTEEQQRQGHVEFQILCRR